MADPDAELNRKNAPLVTRQVSENVVTDESMDAFINRELIPLLFEVRTRVNTSIERPKMPIFNSSPITDADFNPNGPESRDPTDGVFAMSAADNKLYVRVAGVYIASPAFV